MISHQGLMKRVVEFAAGWAAVRFPHVDACNRDSLVQPELEHPSFLLAGEVRKSGGIPDPGRWGFLFPGLFGKNEKGGVSLDLERFPREWELFSCSLAGEKPQERNDKGKKQSVHEG